jgi:exodeoxyribonuclease V beta subunit
LVDAKPCGVSKSKIQPRFFNAWCDKLAAWAQDPSLEQPGLTDSARHRLTTEGMLEAANPGFDLVMPTALNALVGTLDALDHLVPPAAGLRAHAARQVSRRVAQLKAQHGVYGFADMLERLDAALEGADAAEDDGGLPNRASRLRERIVTQYPVALIDEFQDTSPLQSRIFDKLYRIERNDPETGLLLIGDPKQSIYGFRGADIYSYLTARRATQGRHHVLETNHRSTQDLVAAVNHLFGQAELRAGEGAFLLRRHEHDNPLPFSAVKARGREAVLVHSAVGHAAGHVDASEPVAPITICHELDLLDQRSSQRAFAARCAEQIVVWLNDAGAGFEAAGQPFHRLRPADIAVLVRTGREAEAVRRELRRRGVASVYLSDKDSVFASREALDLLRWVRAVASPRDSRLVRAALATATVGLSLAELMLLADDDEAFDKRSEQLRQLHAVWQSQGVLTMLRQTLHLLSLPSRWMAEPDGERRLTNFLHLAELLQNASRQFDTEQALLRWLELRVEEGREGSASGDDQIVRLESDADLVKVVTVHKSKGLEYPVVLLPFVNSVRTVKKKDLSVLSLVDDSGQRRLHLHVTEAGVTQADKERLREDLRLLYVALTRARHALWLGLGAVKNGNSHESRLASSAIGQVLSGGASLKDGALLQALQGLAAPGSGIHLEAADERPNITPLKPQQDDTLLREAPPFDADFERRWSIGSFSALVRNIVHTPLPLLPSMREDDLLDGAQDQGPAVSNFASNFASSSQAWHAFPRGAMPGNFLHDQLEWLAGEQFALNDVEALQAQLLRRCERQGWGHRGAEVVAWLREVVSRPLAPLGAALDGVGTLLPEMEFWLPSQHLKAADVDRLCREHLLHGVARPPLPQRELHGMLMGFADLVFLHDGRYWVLDYKSNHLGARDADYHQGALEASMAQHRYDVQAGLYMLALHRLLKVRLGAGYRPEQHLGGALYLFLRGVNGPQNGCYHVQPDAEFLEALDQALGVREDVSP